MKNNVRNNLGYGKFEVLTIIVVLMIIGAFLAYTIMGNSESQKFSAMRKDASSFSDTVINNFGDGEKEVYTLAEIIDEGLMRSVKNPFGEDNCSIYESRIEVIENTKYLTFKCGNYIINKAVVREKDFDIYKVTKWNETATDENSQSAEVYNCTESDGKLLFDDYLEAASFIYAMRKTYGIDINSIEEAKKSCNVVVKTMYRDLELVDENK